MRQGYAQSDGSLTAPAEPGNVALRWASVRDYTLSERGSHLRTTPRDLSQLKGAHRENARPGADDARVVRAPVLLTAALATWAAIVVSEKAWLYVMVIAAVGVADLPLVARVRVRRGTAVALLVHAGVLVLGWFVAFLVWAPFVGWE